MKFDVKCKQCSAVNAVSESDVPMNDEQRFWLRVFRLAIVLALILAAWITTSNYIGRKYPSPQEEAMKKAIETESIDVEILEKDSSGQYRHFYRHGKKEAKPE